MKILYTGASGRMAVALREALEGEFDAVRLMVRRPPERLFAGEEAVIADLTDLEAVERACAGIDTVIHLGGIADEASFPEILDANIVGTYHLYEAARRAGVRRVVFASSNHATGFYPIEQRIRVEDPPRPDSYYGVSKVFGEALARLYYDKWGIESVCLRIGSFRDAPEDVRQLSIWLSPDDAAELIRRSVRAEHIGYLVAYGVSDNERSFWDNAEPSAALGFIPRDRAEDHAGSIGHSDVSHPFQGGLYCEPGYTGGSWVTRKPEA